MAEQADGDVNGRVVWVTKAQFEGIRIGEAVPNKVLKRDKCRNHIHT